MAEGDHFAMVADLGVPHRAKRAVRELMAAGAAGVPALRAGLSHSSAAVRQGCCVVLDHHLDESCLPLLRENLDHPEPAVRAWALHALGCDRCKEGVCRPGEDDVLPLAMQMAQNDPEASVRGQALGLLAPSAIRRPDVLAVLERVHRHDPSPNNRRMAARALPGGPAYERAAKAARLQATRRAG